MIAEDLFVRLLGTTSAHIHGFLPSNGHESSEILLSFKDLFVRLFRQGSSEVPANNVSPGHSCSRPPVVAAHRDALF